MSATEQQEPEQQEPEQQEPEQQEAEYEEVDSDTTIESDPYMNPQMLTGLVNGATAAIGATGPYVIGAIEAIGATGPYVQDKACEAAATALPVARMCLRGTCHGTRAALHAGITAVNAGVTVVNMGAGLLNHGVIEAMLRLRKLEVSTGQYHG